MQRSRALILFGILVLITVVPALIKFYTDWIWFAQVGYLEVFLRSITARLALGSIAFVLAFGVLAANFYLAARTLTRPDPLRHPRSDHRRARADQVLYGLDLVRAGRLSGGVPALDHGAAQGA